MDWKKIRNILLRHVVPMVALIYVGFGLVLWYFQTDYIYYPTDQVFTDCTLPGGAVATTTGNTRMYYKDTGAPLVVLYHGNAGSACDRMWYAAEFFEPLGLSYAIVEYTGYSNDNEEPDSEKILENTADVIAFIKASGHGPIILMSESIGGGPASYHANQSDVEMLILSTPFASLRETAGALYPIYPATLLLTESYNNREWLRDSNAAIHIIHGTEDRIINAAQAESLHADLTTNDKSITLVSGAGHNDIYNTKEWEERVYELLRAYAP